MSFVGRAVRRGRLRRGNKVAQRMRWPAGGRGETAATAAEVAGGRAISLGHAGTTLNGTPTFNLDAAQERDGGDGGNNGGQAGFLGEPGTVAAVQELLWRAGCELVSAASAERRLVFHGLRRTWKRKVVMKSDITCIARTTLLVVVAGLGSAACGGDEPPSNDSQSGAGAATTQNGSGGGGVGGTGTGGLATGGAGGVGGAAPDLAHKVSVVDQKGEPLANVNLVINDAGGALVGHVKTDALGQAEVEIPEAGSVSALYSQDLSFQIWSVHDIPAKQAVSITVYVYGDPPPPPSDAPTTYEFSICSTPPGTTLVHADNNCDGAFLGPTSPLPLKTDNANCIDDPTQDLIFTASDGDLNAKGWATALGLSTIPGTVVTGQACMTNTTVQSAALSLGDLPASVDEVSFQVYTRLGKASYRNYTHPEPSGGDASSTRTVPSIPGATYEMTLYASSGDNIERSFFNYTLKDEAQLSHVQLTLDDFGWVTAGPVNVASPERPSTTWITSQQPAGDYARLFMSWYTGSATYELNVALAPDHQHSFQFPELPDELADFRPAATSVIRWGVIYEDWPNVNAYAEIVGGATKEAVAGVGDVAVGSTSSK